MIKKILLLSALVFGVSGCMTSTVTTFEYGPKGDVVKKTITSSSDVVDKVMTEMSKKDVIWFTSGWLAKLKVCFFDSETMLPNVTITAGKQDTGHLSLRSKLTPEQIAAIITAMRTKVELSAGPKGASIKDTASK